MVINEQHVMLPDQEQQISTLFPKADFEVEYIKVPAQGWTLHEMKKVGSQIWSHHPFAIIFVSPIPALLKKFSYYEGYDVAKRKGDVPHVFVFHNDKREKRELPDGKIVYAVAREGWQLV